MDVICVRLPGQREAARGDEGKGGDRPRLHPHPQQLDVRRRQDDLEGHFRGEKEDAISEDKSASTTSHWSEVLTENSYDLILRRPTFEWPTPIPCTERGLTRCKPEAAANWESTST